MCWQDNTEFYTLFGDFLYFIVIFKHFFILYPSRIVVFISIHPNSGRVLLQDVLGVYVMAMDWSDIIDQLAMANSVDWHDHLLRREYGHVLRKALDFEVEGQQKKDRPKRTWKKLVEEESVKVGLRMEDALFRSKWRVGVCQIAAGLTRIWPPSLVVDTTRFRHCCLYLSLY